MSNRNDGNSEYWIISGSMAENAGRILEEIRRGGKAIQEIDAGLAGAPKVHEICPAGSARMPRA